MARDLQATPAAQRKAVVVIGVGHLLDRGGFRENPQPAKREHVVVCGEHAVRNRRARGAMKSVAVRDDVAGVRVLGVSLTVTDRRTIAVEPVERGELGLEFYSAAVGEARRAP